MKASWVIFLNTENDRILVIKRSKLVRNANKWGFPGGSSKKKKAKKLAKKEALEEVGIKTKNIKLILKVPTKKKKHYFYLVYLDRQVDITLNYESSNYSWVHIDEFIDKSPRLHKPVKLFLKHYRDGKKETQKIIRSGKATN